MQRHLEKIKSGFTLIELLVVISIMGVLSTIVFSAVSDAREKSRVASAITFATHLYRAWGDEAIAQWKFDEASGSDAFDSGQYKIDLAKVTPLDAVVRTNDSIVPGGKSVDFSSSVSDANDNYLRNSNVTSIFTRIGKKLEDYTVSVWLKLPSSGTYGNPVSAMGTGGRIMVMNFAESNGQILQVGPQPVSCTGATELFYRHSIEPDKWVNVTSSWSKTSKEIRLYIDGKHKFTLKECTSPVSNWTPGIVAVGAMLGGQAHFRGKVDEVVIYGKVLTAMEVQQKYAQALPKYLAYDQKRPD